MTEPLVLPAYLSVGKGRRSLVFLHGIGGSKRSWRHQLTHVAAGGSRAIAWDAPGYGDSVPLNSLSWEALAADLVSLLDHLAIDKAVIIGHSIGGMLALDFTARYAERLEALILTGTIPAFGKPGGKWQQNFLNQRLAPLDAGKTMAELAPTLIATIIGNDADRQGVADAIAGMSRVSAATYRQYLSLLVTFDRRASLTSIAVPTLALAGEKDPVAPAKIMRRMAEKIPGCRYCCLPHCGHLTNFEQPQAFNAAVDEFLAGLER